MATKDKDDSHLVFVDPCSVEFCFWFLFHLSSFHDVYRYIFFHSYFCRYSLFQIAQTITPNIIMFLPRNVDLLQVEELSWLSSPPLCVEVPTSLMIYVHRARLQGHAMSFFTYQKLFSSVQIEKNYVNSYLKGITVYFGDSTFGKMELS